MQQPGQIYPISSVVGITSTPPAPLKKSHFKIFIIFILILLILGGAGGAANYYYNKSHNAPKAYTEADILALIRTKIIPSIVQVRCADVDGGDEVIGGSGTYMLDASNTPMVRTNAHVVLGSDGLFHGCHVYFPRPTDGSFYDSAYVASKVNTYNDQVSIINLSQINGLDYAELILTGPGEDDKGVSYPFPPVQKNTASIVSETCKGDKDINIGDKIYEIGYPAIGNESITLTEGIVSGFTGEFGEMIKVSAVTNHGNSGGIAIDGATGCDYGIPTEATFASGGNLGHVIGSGFIANFLDGMTNTLTYSPPAAASSTDESIGINEKYYFHDFTMKYPDLWTATSSTADKYTQVIFESPLEGALDKFPESLSITSIPNADENAYNAVINRWESYTADEKINSGYTTIDNIKGYVRASKDDSLVTFAVPVVKMIVLFLYKGTLYQIAAFADHSGPVYNDYRALFRNMLDSIKFN